MTNVINLSICRFAGTLPDIPALYCTACGGHPHQSEKVLLALFLTASPSREKPLVQNRSFTKKRQVGFGTRLLPEGRSSQPPGSSEPGGLTDVGLRRRRRCINWDHGRVWAKRKNLNLMSLPERVFLFCVQLT